MIIDLFLAPIFALLTAILSLAPAWSMPDTSGLGMNIGADLAFATGFFPIPDLLAILAIGLAYSAGQSLWNLAMFIYNKIPWLAHN